jgi:hypothetical protein
MEEVEKVAPVEEIPADMPAARQQGGSNVGRTIAIIVVAVVIFVLISLVGYGLVTHPVLTERLRDISIIVLALVTMITSIFLAILLFQLQSLIVLLRDEIQPILESVNETAGTVRGTTTFVSDAVVSPMIRVASYAAGVRTTLKTFAGGSSRQKAPREDLDQEL